MRVASVVALVGLAIAVGALLMILNNSGLVAGNPDMVTVGTWVVVFLLGIFVFGWGLGRRTSL